MVRSGRLGRVLVVAVGVIAMGPALALAMAALGDRGSTGSARLTLFPIALAVFDDHVWECLRNSLAMAIGVTLAARLIGVALARGVVRWRFWGRLPLAALACAGVVVPPAFGAIGLRWWLEPTGAWSDPRVGFAIWFWVSLTSGTPLVAAATASSLARINPRWEDAARLAGAGRWRVWRGIVWPVVRPEVARALTLVFGLTLLEPGAPMVLGLRRTLGFQIAASALDPEPGQLTRAAVLALMGVLLASVGLRGIEWLGGERTASLGRVEAPSARPLAVSAGRGGFWALVLAGGAALTWLPLAGLVAAALSRGSRGLAALGNDLLIQRTLMNSVVLGVAVVVVDLLLARVVVAWSGRGPDGPTVNWPERFPPLALGIGFLALPEVVRMAAEAWKGTGRGGHAGEMLATLADALDPDRTPWIALVLGVGLARLPLVKRSAMDRQRSLRPTRVDAAVTLGATRRQSRRRLSGRLLGVSPSSALLTFALAATSVTPALVLAPTAETRPLGPALLFWAIDDAGGLSRPAALACLAIALNLGALALSARSRLAREWYRG